ncbi:MAG: hypothetical protein AAF221_00605 [Pseudomonadota bacterium]
MVFLEQLLSSPKFAYIVLGALLMEGAALLALWSVRNIGLPPAQTIAFLGAGAGFAAALLILASDGPPIFIGAALIFAFVFHIADICLRWRR